MKEDKTVPQLRFPEFTDAWKQRKLSESAKFSKGNGYSPSSILSCVLLFPVDMEHSSFTLRCFQASVNSGNLN